jgi:hypothetical protein
LIDLTGSLKRDPVHAAWFRYSLLFVEDVVKTLLFGSLPIFDTLIDVGMT